MIKVRMKRFLLIFAGLLFLPGIPQAEAGLEVFAQPLQMKTIPKNAVRVPFLTLWIRADEDTLLHELSLQRTGLSSSNDMGRVWAETSTLHRSMRSGFFSDDTATLRFLRGIEIPAQSWERVIIYANLNNARSGTHIGIDLTDLSFTSLPSED